MYGLVMLLREVGFYSRTGWALNTDNETNENFFLREMARFWRLLPPGVVRLSTSAGLLFMGLAMLSAAIFEKPIWTLF